MRYVRSSHPFICNLEAFFDVRAFGEEIISYAHIYEYCDWGTLENIVEQYYEEPRWGHRVPEAFGPNLKKGHRVYKHAAIPEAFIWHVYSQSMEALSFLHGDHELNKKPEFHRHNQIVMLDIKLDNIFLKDSGRPNTYPDVKLGDFGEATYIEHGKRRLARDGSTMAAPPEDHWISAKYDVWCMGLVLHLMSHSGETARRLNQEWINRNLAIPPQWGTFDPHLSATLCEELRIPREMDVDKRWTAAKIWERIRPLAEERIPLMYRALEPWAKPKLQLEFDDKELELVARSKAAVDVEAIEDILGGDQGDAEKDALASASNASAKMQPKPQSEKQLEKKQKQKEEQRAEKLLEQPPKRKRGDGDEKENLPFGRPPKRRLKRYRKLRAYRI